ncbi:MAG: Fic family protein [Pseudomonadota bacterium]
MTGSGRSAREQAAFESVHDPETGVLCNRLGIRDAETLEHAERYFAAKRMQQGLPPEANRLDAEGLKAIHRHLFQDVYDWAGNVRTYTTGRGPAPFAPPEQIQPWLNRQFAALRRDDGLRGLPPHKFAERAAAVVNEINAAHPFIEGNGRVQRTWLRNLGEQAGHRISFRSSDKDRWNDASRIGFEKVNYEPMAALIRDAMNPERSREQEGEERRAFKRVPAPKRERSR